MMVVKEEQDRVKTLISDTVTLLCRNGLSYKSKFCINALIGITLDEDDIFLVDIRETIKTLNANDSAAEDSDSHVNNDAPSPASNVSSRKRKRQKKKATEQNTHLSDSESDVDSTHRNTERVEDDFEEHGGDHPGDEEDGLEIEPPVKKTIIKEEQDDDDSGDLVFIKDEPPDVSNITSFSNTSYHQEQQPSHSDILDSLAQQGQLYGTPTSELPGSSQWEASASQMSFSQPHSSQFRTTPSSESSAQSPVDGMLAWRRIRQPSCTCQLCGRAYNTKDKLNAHLYSKHQIATRVQCLACEKTFTRKDVMMVHFKKIHLNMTLAPNIQATPGH